LKHEVHQEHQGALDFRTVLRGVVPFVTPRREEEKSFFLARSARHIFRMALAASK
jgi:hypothetical protein